MCLRYQCEVVDPSFIAPTHHLKAIRSNKKKKKKSLNYYYFLLAKNGLMMSLRFPFQYLLGELTDHTKRMIRILVLGLKQLVDSGFYEQTI